MSICSTSRASPCRLRSKLFRSRTCASTIVAEPFRREQDLIRSTAPRRETRFGPESLCLFVLRRWPQLLAQATKLARFPRPVFQLAERERLERLEVLRPTPSPYQRKEDLIHRENFLGFPVPAKRSTSGAVYGLLRLLNLRAALHPFAPAHRNEAWPAIRQLGPSATDEPTPTPPACTAHVDAG